MLSRFLARAVPALVLAVSTLVTTAAARPEVPSFRRLRHPDAQTDAVSRPEMFRRVGPWTYFVGAGPLGRELYRTSGNTVDLVADLEPGPASSNPRILGESVNRLFFTVDRSGAMVREVYSTDGTEAGTRLAFEVEGAKLSVRLLGEVGTRALLMRSRAGDSRFEILAFDTVTEQLSTLFETDAKQQTAILVGDSGAQPTAYFATSAGFMEPFTVRQTDGSVEGTSVVSQGASGSESVGRLLAAIGRFGDSLILASEATTGHGTVDRVNRISGEFDTLADLGAGVLATGDGVTFDGRVFQGLSTESATGPGASAVLLATDGTAAGTGTIDSEVVSAGSSFVVGVIPSALICVHGSRVFRLSSGGSDLLEVAQLEKPVSRDALILGGRLYGRCGHRIVSVDLSTGSSEVVFEGASDGDLAAVHGRLFFTGSNDRIWAHDPVEGRSEPVQGGPSLTYDFRSTQRNNYYTEFRGGAVFMERRRQVYFTHGTAATTRLLFELPGDRWIGGLVESGSKLWISSTTLLDDEIEFFSWDGSTLKRVAALPATQQIVSPGIPQAMLAFRGGVVLQLRETSNFVVYRITEDGRVFRFNPGSVAVHRGQLLIGTGGLMLAGDGTPEGMLPLRSPDGQVMSFPSFFGIQVYDGQVFAAGFNGISVWDGETVTNLTEIADSFFGSENESDSNSGSSVETSDSASSAAPLGVTGDEGLSPFFIPGREFAWLPGANSGAIVAQALSRGRSQFAQLPFMSFQEVIGLVRDRLVLSDFGQGRIFSLDPFTGEEETLLSDAAYAGSIGINAGGVVSVGTELLLIQITTGTPSRIEVLLTDGSAAGTVSLGPLYLRTPFAGGLLFDQGGPTHEGSSVGGRVYITGSEQRFNGDDVFVFDVGGVLESEGSSCASAIPGRLYLRGRGHPRIGETVEFDATLEGRSVAVLLFGPPKTGHLPLGIPGCELEIDMLAAGASPPVAVGEDETVGFSLPIPDDPALVGLELTFQYLCDDSEQPFALTNAMRMRIGE